MCLKGLKASIRIEKNFRHSFKVYTKNFKLTKINPKHFWTGIELNPNNYVMQNKKRVKHKQNYCN